VIVMGVDVATHPHFAENPRKLTLTAPDGHRIELRKEAISPTMSVIFTAVASSSQGRTGQ
jgi:hypothetical protein